MTVVRGLAFSLASALPTPLLSLLGDYRLLTNEVLREALLTGQTSRGALSRFARDRAFVHHLTGQHAVVASGIALSLARGHRQRQNQGGTPRVPYIRRRFLRTNTSTFHFDPGSGKVRLSLRNGEWCSFFVRTSAYHRSALASPGVRVKQLHVSESGLVLYLERPVPPTYSPTSLLALDTNESSLDGVSISPTENRCVRVSFPELRTIQARHFIRRRFLGKKKAHDRRVSRRLLRKEGERERHRIRSRLHVISRRLVETAARNRAALALEDLTGLSVRKRGSARTHRRLSSWPRRELHRQLAYTAAERGVPVLWIDPYRTSATCPRCGEYSKPRRRVEPTFACEGCSWRMDRQLNAGVNVGRTALRATAELGGLRLDLDALSEDAMRPLYPFEQSKGQGRSGGRGRDSTPKPRLRRGEG